MSFKIWDKPCGEMILLNNKADLVELINKLGFESPYMLEEFGIFIKKRQMTEDELSDYDMVFNPDCPEETLIYDCEHFETVTMTLPMFNHNDYMEIERHFSHESQYETTAFKIKENDIESLDEAYDFPCMIYINLSNGDFFNDVECKFWHVKSLKTVNTIQSLKEYEDKYSDNWISNHKEKIEFEKKKALHFKSKKSSS